MGPIPPLQHNWLTLIYQTERLKRMSETTRNLRKRKLKLPVLAVGSKDFIGKEVKKQTEYMAENVEYQELNFGHQLAEECPEQLAKIYLGCRRCGASG